MRIALVVSLALSLIGCTLSSPPSSSSSPCPDAGAEVPDAGATLPDAGPDAAPPPADASPDAELDAGPCALRIDAIAPQIVQRGEAATTPITLRGCGFLGVRDVEVNVYSVPFTVVDDSTITFLPWAPDADFVGYPIGLQVDVLRVQPDQVQTTLIYQ